MGRAVTPEASGMRRADREVTDREAIDDVLRRAEVLHLAMSGPDGPYVVPVNFGYDGEAIWVHCAEAGRKLDMLATDPRVCFEASVDVEVVPGESCWWRTHFRSVVGFGTAHLVEDSAEKASGLGVLVGHYSGRPETVAIHDTEGVAVLRIDIERITGKACAG
jgi:nitroimidazol reductase NimA-like FMN-containing flavoprotein (pyridoxamine 5'-phosphate oxidase superfamily)